MSEIPEMIPGAVCVAVTSGKGGVGKTTTAAALAVALAARGHDVVAIDGDTTGANLHLVLGVDSMGLSAQREPLELVLPEVSGVRIASPASFEERANIRLSELVSATRFARWPTHIVVDLPGGWSEDHEAVASLLPDVVVCAVAPTVTAVADHLTHTSAWRRAWAAVTKKVRESDKRRKWAELPEEPTVIEVETMARFAGVTEDTGEQVTIRRSDALSAAELADSVEVLTSMPATATVSELAETTEMGVLVDAIEKLESRTQR